MVEANPQSKPKAIGIDLGTTFTCAAVVEPLIDGETHAVTIHCSTGEKTIPSVVGFRKDRILVGQAAAKLTATFPESTVYDAKRLLGRRIEDEEVKSDIKFWPFEVGKGKRNDKPLYKVKMHDGETKDVRPEYVSSYVLQKVRDDAKQRLDTQADLECVVTIPAHFNKQQRNSTIDSIRMSNLNLLALLEEPVAAALSQGLLKYVGQNAPVNRLILVYDFGGGTLDLTILRIENKTFKTIATDGNSHLGGQDVDNNLVNHLIQCYGQDEDMRDEADVRSNAKTLAQFKKSVSFVKTELAGHGNDESEFYVDVQGNDFERIVTQDEFEREAIEPLRNKLTKPLQSIFENDVVIE